MQSIRTTIDAIGHPEAQGLPPRSDASVSLWSRAAERSSYAALGGDASADVVVIGGGLVGLLTAYLCKKAGLRVIVLEAHEIGSGESSRTTGHVTAQLDARWSRIVDDFGPEGARALASAGMLGIQDLEDIVAELHVDCGWRRVPAWLFTEDERGLQSLRREAEVAAAAGIDCRLVGSDVPLPWHVAGALVWDRQADLEPEPFLVALARAVDGDGSRVCEATRALEVHDGAEPTVVTANGTVRARHVVVATHAPFNNRILMQTKLAHYRSYVLALRGGMEVPPGLFWDDQKPYHYMRTTEHGGRRFVLVGGGDHRTGEGDGAEALASLERWALERLPRAVIEHHWSGQILQPVDGLPYVGRNSFQHNVHEATGFAGTGWAYGALAARILVDAVQGLAHPLAETLAATRITPRASAGTYVRENARFPWHFLGDRLSVEATEIRSLPVRSGKLFMARGGQKIAVYRDDDGELRTLSPICPHLGCLVHFNATETSWDCPCHGSRFAVDGQLISGPASTGLARLDLSPESTALVAVETRAGAAAMVAPS